MGRLHTRYAPVRRWHCCPLDLHVLSLPLAFILSQDQTLHCKILVFILGLDVCLARTSQQVNELYSSTINGFRLVNSNLFKLNYPSLSPLPSFIFNRTAKLQYLILQSKLFLIFFSTPQLFLLFRRFGVQRSDFIFTLPNFFYSFFKLIYHAPAA